MKKTIYPEQFLNTAPRFINETKPSPFGGILGNGDTPQSAAWHAWAALIVAVLITAAVGTVIVGSLILMVLYQNAEIPWKVWASVFIVLVVLFATCLAWLGSAWTVARVKRPWVIEDTDRAFRRQQEEWAFEQVKAQASAPADAPALSSNAARLDLVGRMILELHYMDDLDATRPQAESAGITQQEWQHINDALQALGVKTRRGWSDDWNYADALAAWRHRVRITDDRVISVSSETGSETRRIHPRR